MSELSKQALKVENNTSFPNNNSGLITPQILRDFNTDMIDSLVDEIGYTADSASWNQQINALEVFTASAITSAITASSLVTASVVGNVITFTKGNASTFNITVATGSGGGGDVTALNAFTASQLTINSGYNTFTQSANTSITNLNTTTASLNSSVSQLNANTASQQASINSLNSATSSLFTSASLSLTTASFAGNTLTFRKGDGTTFGVVIPDVSGSTINTGSLVTTASFNAYTSSNDQKVNSLISATGSYATTGSNTFNGVQTIRTTGGTPLIVDHSDASPTQNTLIGIFKSGSAEWSVGNLGTDDSFVVYNPNAFQTPLSIRQDNGVTLLGSLTASLQQGYVWAGGVGNISTLVATSSFGGGGTINTGSFATTGSNTFTGDQTLIDASSNYFTIVNASGSLMLVGKTMTSSSLHLSQSAAIAAAGGVNLIFKTNNLTTDTIISGSNNIFQNPSTPTAGFKRYLTSNNISLAGGFPQISSSMAFSPTVSNNYFGGGITMRGPVSASAWTITGNNILGSVLVGTGVGTHAQALTSGLALTSNLIAGTVGIVANQTSFTGSQTAISTNIIPGTAVLTLNQSAAQLALNVINDANFNLTNNYFSQSAGLGQISILRNNILGQSNSIIVTGSQPAGTTNAPSYNDNFIGGSGNIIFADASTARVVTTNAYHSAARNIIFGQNLIVTASSFINDSTGLGSAFFGRWNSVTGNADMTAETIFAVGTGTSTSVRKTGFLIDSGSNTFVEGTLNVSGSTTITGSAPTILSSSFSGSLITNLTDIYTDVPAVQQIVTLTSASYAGLASGSLLDSNTLYVVSGSIPTQTINTGSFATTGSNNFVGNQVITGSLILSSSALTELTVIGNAIISGNLDIQSTLSASLAQGFTYVGDALGRTTLVATSSFGGGGGGTAFPFTGSAQITGSLGVTGSFSGFVNNLSISSNTASMDFNNGNFFRLQLVSGSITHLTATNIRPGQTINLLVQTASGSASASGSLTFSPTFKFAGGFDYTPTAITASKDIVSFVTFDTTEIFAGQIKNLS